MNAEAKVVDGWVAACAVGDIPEEDVIRLDVGERTFCVYRGAEDDYYASDGLCTHEHAHLADGFVIDDVIECPMHNGRFSIKTGEAVSPPACVDLVTYPVKIEDGRVWLKVG